MHSPLPGVPGLQISGLPGPATHHACLGVDLCGSTGLARADLLYLRGCLYRLLRDGCAAAGIVWDDLHVEDRGDGALLVAPPQVSVELLLGPVTAWLHSLAHLHNRTAGDGARLRLRVAVTAGHLQFDAFGVAGSSLNLLFRLLNSSAVRTVMAAHRSDFVLVTSDHVHREVVAAGSGWVDQRSFSPVWVEHKETSVPAWTWIPPAAALGGPLPGVFPQVPAVGQQETA